MLIFVSLCSCRYWSPSIFIPRLYQFMLSMNHIGVDDYDTVEAPSNAPNTWVWMELILTASAACVCVCVCFLCSISWWCWNHIFLHHRRSKSLEGNFRFSTEDNILLMSAVNIQAHGTQNDKIKIMWIRLRPQVGILYYERICMWHTHFVWNCRL